MALDEERDFARTLTILCVEDDPDTLELMVRPLRRRFGRVVEAVDGAAGLAAFEAERPDLVITDVQMPRLDGLGMAVAIRALAPRVPIVVATAFEEVGYLRRAIEAGVDRYVTKPIDIAQLDAALGEAARRVRAERALEQQRQAALDELRSASLEASALLAGGVAHELNGIVQAILTSFELAVGLAPEGGELREVLDEGLASTRAAARLGASLRALSSEAVVLAPGDVVPLVERALLSATEGSRLALRLALPRRPLVVDMDPLALRRLFLELGRSAARAGREKGTLTATAGVRALDDGELVGLPAGEYVEIAVHDDGPSLSPELARRIFEPFVGVTDHALGPRQGLGLAASAAIAKKHGGHLSVDVASGTTFRLLLPFAGRASRG